MSGSWPWETMSPRQIGFAEGASAARLECEVEMKAAMDDGVRLGASTARLLAGKIEAAPGTPISGPEALRMLATVLDEMLAMKGNSNG